MLSLQVTYVGGLVEACRLTDDDIFSAIFEEVRKHIDDTKAELVVFNDVIKALNALAHQPPHIMHTVSNAAKHIQQDQEKLTGIIP